MTTRSSIPNSMQLAAIALAAVLASPTFAVQKTPSGGWHNAAVWSPSGLPTTNDWVVVTGTGTHALNMNHVADSLTVNFASGLYNLVSDSGSPYEFWSLTLYGTGLDSRTNALAVTGGADFRVGDLVASGRGRITITLGGAETNFSFHVATNSTLHFTDGPGSSESSIAGAGKNLAFGGGGTMTLDSTNTFGGVGNTFTLSAGTLNINVAGALGNVNNTFVVNGGSFGKSTAGALTLNSYKHTWNSNFTFSSSANLNLGTNTVSLGGSVVANISSNTLTVGGAVGDGGGGHSLTKTGSGTLALNATASHGGSTVVQQGTLTLGSAGLITSPIIEVAAGATLNVSAVSGGFELGSGQTLSGAGQVVGAMRAGDGSTLAPGSSPGILVVDDLTLGGGSTSFFEIGGTGLAGTDYDVIQSAGSLAYEDGWKLQIAFTSLAPISGTLKLFDFASYGSGFAPEIIVVGNADSTSFNTATGELTFANASAVPEPGTALLLAVGTGLLLATRTRQRHAS